MNKLIEDLHLNFHACRHEVDSLRDYVVGPLIKDLGEIVDVLLGNCNREEKVRLRLQHTNLMKQTGTSQGSGNQHSSIEQSFPYCSIEWTQLLIHSYQIQINPHHPNTQTNKKRGENLSRINPRMVKYTNVRCPTRPLGSTQRNTLSMKDVKDEISFLLLNVSSLNAHLAKLFNLLNRVVAPIVVITSSFCFLRDGYDFSDAQFVSAQKQGKVLAGIVLATDAGDRRVSQDLIKNATFKRKMCGCASKSVARTQWMCCQLFQHLRAPSS